MLVNIYIWILTSICPVNTRASASIGSHMCTNICICKYILIPYLDREEGVSVRSVNTFGTGLIMHADNWVYLYIYIFEHYTRSTRNTDISIVMFIHAYDFSNIYITVFWWGVLITQFISIPELALTLIDPRLTRQAIHSDWSRLIPNKSRMNWLDSVGR